MDDTQFDALVRRLEREERERPSLYRWRVALLAALGYGYIGLVLLVLVALLAGTIAIMATGHGAALFKLVIALLVAAWFILRALWVRLDPPQGRILTRGEAPALFAEADAIAQALQAPRADVVLLNTDFNASVAQVPRLGMLGFPRNYLVIGMPLLCALPGDQIRAVLAHEFAHLSRAHGTFGSWCYRVRVTWLQLLSALEREQHWSAAIFRRFFHWYVPVFSAYTFVLMRRHEFEADTLAAGIVGPATMGQTLVDMDVRGAMLGEQFWSGVWEDAKRQPAPPDDIYGRLGSTTTTHLPDDFGSSTLAVALQRQTETNDTHPSLKERLEHVLGDAAASVRPTAQFSGRGADAYLGASCAALQDELSGAWKAECEQQWKQLHGEHETARRGIEALDARPGASWSPQDRLQYALWTEYVHGWQQAAAHYEHALREDPSSAPATFAVARVRLNASDESGLALLNRAMELDNDSILSACQVAYGYLHRLGRPEAARYKERWTERQQLLLDAEAERSKIEAGDSYVPSDLDDASRGRVVAQLDATTDVARAFLVRKKVKTLDVEFPMHVLLVEVAVPTFLYRSADAQRDTVDRVARSLTVPDQVHLFVITNRQGGLVDTLKKVPGSLLYQASTRKAERRAHKATTPR